MDLVGLYLYSYIVGSVPTAYIVGRLAKGIDIRQYGSGNVGGANLYQNVGWKWVVPLGFFELFAKGGSTIWIGIYLLDLERGSWALIVAPLLAIAGNNWSLFLKFSGGRGIAVALGTQIALAPIQLVLFSSIALGGSLIFRSSGTWVYISLLLLPLWSWALGEPEQIIWYFGGLIGIVSAKRLLANWERLPAGVPKYRVLFNRIIKDRDTDPQEDWVGRTPIEREPSAR